MVDINAAMSAYNMALNRAHTAISTGRIDNKTAPIMPINPIGGDGESISNPSSFGSLLKTSVQKTEAIQRKAEHLTKLSIAGQADILEVTMAVNDAETTLQSVIQIRDKVVSAYKEILAMPM